MKERKLLKMVMCVVVLLGMVVAAQAGTRGVTKDQITVGTHTALSGPVAGWGIDATNGVRMRFDEPTKPGEFTDARFNILWRIRNTECP